MQTAALLVGIAATAAHGKQGPTSEQLTRDYSFKQYQQDFSKEYVSDIGRARRQAIFQRNLQKVITHNEKSQSYKMNVNHFSDLTEEEFTGMLGGKAREMHHHTEALKKQPHVKAHKLSGKPLPAAVDWRNHRPNVMTAVKNQGHCGSCWTFASSETVESHWAIATGYLVDVSQEQIASCAPNPDRCGGTGGCQGGTAEVAYDYLTKLGSVAGDVQYPYTAGAKGNTAPKCNRRLEKMSTGIKIHGYTAVMRNNQEAVMDAVAHKGPLAVNVDASKWKHYSGGIYDGCDYAKNITMNHAVQLVGYGTDAGKDYWLVRNSWKPTWGERGYIRVAKSKGASKCGWDVKTDTGVGCTGSPDHVWTCGECGILYQTVYPHLDIK